MQKVQKIQGTFFGAIRSRPMFTRFILFAIFVLFPLTTWAQSEDCDTARWYCVDEFNAGLVERDGLGDQSTPRAAVETLIHRARNAQWTQASHLLDLGGVPQDQRGVVGPELIEQLYIVINRKTVIDWDILLDRPDALDARAGSDEAMAGQPRKSLLLWTVALDDHPAAIRLNRVKPADGDPVWVFSRQTTGDIPALFDKYGPGEIEKLLPDALMQKAALGFMWWEIIGLPILLLASLFTGRLVWKMVDRLAEKAGQNVVQETLKAVRGPSATGAATGFALLVGSGVFVFSGQISTILTPVAWMGVLASMLWLGVNSVEVILDRLTSFEETDLTQRQEEHKRTMATRIAAARRAFIVIVVLIGGGLFLSQTNIFQNLGLTLLGTAGALTLVLGFAARRVLGNIMASLQIALNGSAKIGDRIVYKDYLCNVERINFTYVQLRDWDGTRLVVPVEEFVSNAFENWTMKEPEMLRIIKVKCAHDADVDQLRDAFDRIIDDLDQGELGDLDKVKVRVADQDVFGKDVWFALPCIDPNTSWDLACIAREKLMSEGARIAQETGIDVFPDANPAEAA